VVTVLQAGQARQVQTVQLVQLVPLVFQGLQVEVAYLRGLALQAQMALTGLLAFQVHQAQVVHQVQTGQTVGQEIVVSVVSAVLTVLKVLLVHRVHQVSAV
jgi:hypothetical protein